MLSDKDIKKLLNKEIVIYPYEEDDLTPLGYNFNPSDFAMSINEQKLLEREFRQEKVEKIKDGKPIEVEENIEYYIIPPNDTALILTSESIWVSMKIAGTFHSKVGVVSTGFGHISTTLDPNWKGPLLISLNNPTNKPLKLPVNDSFITLMFYRLDSPATKDHDNDPSRIKILKSITDDMLSKELDELKTILIKKAQSLFVNPNVHTAFEEKVNKIHNDSKSSLLEGINNYKTELKWRFLWFNLFRLLSIIVGLTIAIKVPLFFIETSKLFFSSIDSISMIALIAIFISSFQMTIQLKRK